MSTRFVPFNYEKPKGLLNVKGEVLIERQIRQLREKGIEEIVVVVGHMKEQFEYLSEKYGVILVEATDYAEKNNHASVYAARDYLKNTIITSSDLYFEENFTVRSSFPEKLRNEGSRQMKMTVSSIPFMVISAMISGLLWATHFSQSVFRTIS